MPLGSHQSAVGRIVMANTTKTLAIATSLAVGLLIALEGYRAEPYVDIAGVLTECYGNTHGVDPKRPKTQEQCKALLTHEVGRIGQRIVRDQPDVPPKVLAAGISFVYNVGVGNYARSTFRRKLRQGDYTGACEGLLLFNKYTDPKTGKLKFSQGLQNRRDKEYKLCLKGASEVQP